MSSDTVITVKFKPKGAAKELFRRRDDEVLLSGPAGTGKSYAAMFKMHLAALKYPGMRGLIVRKTAVSLGSTALVTWRERVAKEAIAAGVLSWYGGSQQEAAGYRYENGSVINVGGMDKPTRIMSSEYDLAYAQEAIELSLEDWEAITSRLRNGVLPYQQLIADTNPDKETHWLNQRGARGATVILESRHEDNPILFTDGGLLTKRGKAYMAKLDALTGVRYLRLRLGKWAAAEGQVYEDFDRHTHLIDRFDVPEDWPRYWVVDFGFKNPFVLQCWAEDPDGRLVLYREIYRSKRLVEDHARDILRVVTDMSPDIETRESDELEPLAALQAGRRAWNEPKPRAIICDHDAEDRATLERHLGMGTVAADKAKTVGIQLVQARLKVPADGRPRLVLMRDSVIEKDPVLIEAAKPTCTEEEFPGYVWPPKKAGHEEKEDPIKEDDHGLDDVRYLVAHRDRRRRNVDRDIWLD